MSDNVSDNAPGNGNSREGRLGSNHDHHSHHVSGNPQGSTPGRSAGRSDLRRGPASVEPPRREDSERGSSGRRVEQRGRVAAHGDESDFEVAEPEVADGQLDIAGREHRQPRTITLRREGPLPSPDELEGYRQLNANYPERIFSMAEKTLDAELADRRSLVRAEAFSVVFVAVGFFVVAVLALGAAVWMAFAGIPNWWAILGIGVFSAAAGLVAAIKGGQSDEHAD